MNGWIRQKYVYRAGFSVFGVFHVAAPTHPFDTTFTSPGTSLQRSAGAGSGLAAVIGAVSPVPVE